MATSRGRALATVAPPLWSTLLALLLLGPALAPGYVLSYDMVWVPDLALRPDFWGVGSALPRAVPSDAVVAVLDEVVPGMLLQKLVLLGSLVFAGWGSARLVSGLGTAPSLVASGTAIWNPYLVERLWLGHWPLLVGYAALPWVALAAARTRRGEGVSPALPLLMLVGSLSAWAGLMTAAAALAFGWRRGRAGVVLVALAVAVNLPWLVSGLLHAGDATSSAAGAEAFAARDEGSMPAALAVLGLGGIWNHDVVPGSRLGWLGVAATVLLLGAAAAGARRWWRRGGTLLGRRGPLVCAGVGWGLALLSAMVPGLLGWLAAEVPGGGLLRDGTRLLGLCVPLLVLLVGHAVAALLEALPSWESRVAVAGVLCLLPLALLPDATWGGLGRLRAVGYPPAWEEVRDVVGTADGYDVLVLPFSSYRAPAWNGDRKVLDPLGRYLRPDYVASDVLYVRGKRLPGEDPRARRIEQVLQRATPEGRSRALARQGVGVVVTDREAPGEAPVVSGRSSSHGQVLVNRLDDPTRVMTPPGWRLLMATAWSGWLLVPVAAAAATLARRRRRVSR